MSRPDGWIGLLARLTSGDELPGRARIERAIAEVLARPEYQPPARNWWDQFKDWLGRLFGGVLRGLYNIIDPATPLGMAIIGFLVLSLIALVGHIVWTLFFAVSSSSSRRAPSRLRPGMALPSPEAVADDLAAARRLAGEGSFAAAMHALYRATLFWLDQRGAARFEPSKTAGDYARELAAGDARRSFRGLVESFDPVAWGGRTARQEQWERMRAAASALGVPA